MPPTMHESTKHPHRERRPVSIDRPPKINGSGIPDSLPFHKKYVSRPQKKFSDRPLFQKGAPGAGRGPAKSVREGVTHGVYRSFSKNNGSGIPGSLPFHEKYVAIRKKVFGSTPFSKGVAGLQGGDPAKRTGCRGALRKVYEQGQGGESRKEYRGRCEKLTGQRNQRQKHRAFRKKIAESPMLNGLFLGAEDTELGNAEESAYIRFLEIAQGDRRKRM